MKRFKVRRVHGETKDDRRLRQLLQDDAILEYLECQDSYFLAKWLTKKLNNKERSEVLQEIQDEYDAERNGLYL